MAKTTEKNKAIGLSNSVVAAAKAGATVLPIAVGAGITAHSIYQNRNEMVDMFANTNLNKLSDTQHAINSFLRNNNAPTAREIGRQIAGLRTTVPGPGGMTELKMADIMTAWQQAARSIPDQTLAGRISDKLKLATTSQQMMDTLALELNSGSIYTNRAASIFINNINRMGSVIGSGGTINLAGITPLKIKPVMSNLGIARFFGSNAKENTKVFHGALGAKTSFVKLSGGVLGDESIRFRISHHIGGGIVSSGVGGQTHNIAGAFAIWDGNQITGMMNYDEWVMRRIEHELAPALSALGPKGTARDMRRIAKDFETSLRSPFEWIPQTFSGEMDHSYAMARKLAGHTVTVVDPTGKPLHGDALASFYKVMPNVRLPSGPTDAAARKLFPLSPNRILGAKFTTFDPASFGAFPEIAPYTRRPGQANRSFIPSNKALNSIQLHELSQRHKYAVGDAFAHESDMQLFKTPAGKTLYTTRNVVPGLGQGQILINKNMRPMFEQTTLENVVLDSNAINPSLLNPEINHELDPNMLLGFSPEGRAVLAGENAALSGVAVFPKMKAGEGGLVKLGIQRTYPAGQFQKVFGGGKGMARFVKENLTQGYDYVIHMDELRKNRSLLHKQMLTALTEFNHENMKSFSKMAVGKRGYVDDKIAAAIAMSGADLDQLRRSYKPEELMTLLSMEMKGGPVDTTAGISKIINWARVMEVSPEQAGLIFGAVPHALGVESASALHSQFPGLRQEWLPHIMKGEAMGVAHLYSAGPKALTGAGISRASIEPRIFELFEAGQFNPTLSNIMREDLINRRLAMDPELLFTRGEMEKTLRGLAGQKLGMDSGARVLDIRDPNITRHMFSSTNKNFVANEGAAFVNMGGLAGMGHVYIPGAGTLKSMAVYRTPEGKEIQSKLMEAYGDFFTAAREASFNPDRMGAFNTEHKRFLETIHAAHAETMFGVQGVAGVQRGEILGSRFLTGVSTETAGQEVFRVGISRKNFDAMWQEMLQLADRQNMTKAAKRNYIEQLHTMNDAFKNGAPVGGYLARHPFFEQFSFTPVQFFHDKSLHDDVINIPYISKMAQVEGMGNVALDWSLVKGMGGDFDADIYGAILGSPLHQKQLVSAASTGSHVSRAFEDYSIRQQLMKVRSAKDVGLSAEQAMVGDVQKMALSGKIGQLSFEMSRARYALLSKGVNEHTGGALSLLSWLEQNVISGKHATAEQAAHLPQQIDDIIAQVRHAHGDMSTLGGIIESMTDAAGSDILYKDIKMSVDGQQRVVKGINLKSSLSEIGSSLRRLDDQHSVEVMSGMRKYFLERGKSAIKASEIGAYLAEANAVAHNAGTFAQSATRTLERMNNITSAGGRAIARYGKPLALGFGASIALAAIISNPVSNLDPMDPPIVNAKFNNPVGGATPENMHPDDRAIGQPTAPGMATGARPLMRAPTPMSAMISVRGNTGNHFDPDKVSGAVSQAMGRGTRVNTRVQDNRRKLNAQSVADIITR